MSHKTDLKRRTRERMAKTGETYTRARDAIRKQIPPLDSPLFPSTPIDEVSHVIDGVGFVKKP